MSESVPQSTAGDDHGWSADAGPDGSPMPPRRPTLPPTLTERLAALVPQSPVSARRLLAGAIVVGAVVATWLWMVRSPAPPVERSLPRAAPSAGSGSPAAAGRGSADPPTTTSHSTVPVIVHAAGAVRRPGVYRLGSGDRVDDLMAAAGGLAAGADGNRLNLAAPLVDGERVYVPRIGELAVPAPVGQSDATAAAGADTGGNLGPPAGGTTPPVDINTATAEQLDTLPGIGPSTARAILDYRSQHGRFQSVDELLEVRGIGDAKLAELRSKVAV